MQYLFLISAWAMFGLLHSVLAHSGFKQYMQGLMKNSYKYYRLLYSCFATLTLLAVLWLHLTIKNSLLWQNSLVERVSAAVLAIPAVIVLVAAAKKYFLDLSGIDVLLKRLPVAAHLEQTGLHKWVRHPLYSGTILLVWCIFLWTPSPANIISAACITLYTRIGIYFEEKKLVLLFGEEYIAYASKVPMLVPGL
jgi:methanethiol S-methyltransferase